jgi:hypothetical protein
MPIILRRKGRSQLDAMAKASSNHGVDLETKILDSSLAEVQTAKPKSQGVTQQVEVSYRLRGRATKIRIVADVIQNQAAASHSKGSPFSFLFQNVQNGVPRTLREALTLHGPEGQVVIDSGTIDVEDIWTGLWVTDMQPAQDALDVKN